MEAMIRCAFTKPDGSGCSEVGYPIKEASVFICDTCAAWLQQELDSRKSTEPHLKTNRPKGVKMPPFHVAKCSNGKTYVNNHRKAVKITFNDSGDLVQLSGPRGAIQIV